VSNPWQVEALRPEEQADPIRSPAGELPAAHEEPPPVLAAALAEAPWLSARAVFEGGVRLIVEGLASRLTSRRAR
jgi:hypothetical protein